MSEIKNDTVVVDDGTLRAAEEKRPHLRRLADQLGSVYTPVVLAVAGILVRPNGLAVEAVVPGAGIWDAGADGTADALGLAVASTLSVATEGVLAAVGTAAVVVAAIV